MDMPLFTEFPTFTNKTIASKYEGVNVTIYEDILIVSYDTNHGIVSMS